MSPPKAKELTENFFVRWLGATRVIYDEIETRRRAPDLADRSDVLSLLLQARHDLVHHDGPVAGGNSGRVGINAGNRRSAESF